MIHYKSQNQLTLEQFDVPFLSGLDEHNRWVKLSECIPWDELAKSYYKNFTSTTGRPIKDAQLVIGAVIIKHKLNLSDRETVSQIQENPYLQYFVGLPGYQNEEPFAPSLFVEIRKRMGQSIFDEFQQTIINAVAEEKHKKQTGSSGENTADKDSGSDDNEPPTGTQAKESDKEAEPDQQGKLILDATVAPQAIRYPTDLSLLNEAREFSEQIIDKLYPWTDQKKKPRTYRVKARKVYLAIAKQKRPSAKNRRKGIKQQLQYLRRNLGHIEKLLEHWPEGTPVDALPRWLMSRYWVIQHLYQQQKEMYKNRTRRCDERVVSISQPYVRPIILGKLNHPVEFGAKLSASLNGDGIACIDGLRWNAFHEGKDLQEQVEIYRERMGYYPEVVYADPAYGSRENRAYLKGHGIRFAGKPLGRPRKATEENREALKKLKAQRREDYLQRIPIEGKFAWINSIFLVMNLAVLLRLFFALWKNTVFARLVGLLSIQIALFHQCHTLHDGRCNIYIAERREISY